MMDEERLQEIEESLLSEKAGVAYFLKRGEEPRPSSVVVVYVEDLLAEVRRLRGDLAKALKISPFIVDSDPLRAVICGSPDWEDPLWEMLEVSFTGPRGLCTWCGKYPSAYHPEGSTCRAAHVLRVLKDAADNSLPPPLAR